MVATVVKKTECPLQKECLTPSIIYKAEITNDIDEEKRIYIGAAVTPFKDRFRNHTKDFKHKKYRTSTELSKYVWTLKDEGKVPIVKWRIVKKVPCKVKANYCKLCLTEKSFIIKSLDDEKLLNKRTEFISKCRHDNKLVIKNVCKDSKD